MPEPFWEFLFKILPNLVSIIFCLNKFSFSLVARGIQAHKETCNDFDNVEDKGFPCLLDGVTALSIIYAAISWSISIITISHLSGLSGLDSFGTFLGLGVLIACLAYIIKIDSGLFTIRNTLSNSRYRLLRYIGKRPDLWTNVVCLILLAIYYRIIPFLY